MKTTVVNKDKQIADLASKIEKAKAVYLVDFLGLTVEEINNLRAQLRNEKVYYKVVKNTLIKRAMSSLKVTSLDAFMKGPTAVVVGIEDDIAAAKVLIDFSKKQKSNLPVLKVAFIDGCVFSSEQVEAISKLPSKQVLIGMLAGTLNAPVVKLAGTLQSLITQVLFAVNAVKEKKQ